MKKLIILTFFLVSTGLAGCSSTDKYVPMPNLVHRMDIQQGNMITQDMVNKLKPGMTKDQVRYIMGTPPIVDAFNLERWDYVYMYKGGRQDEDEAERRRVSLYFKDNKLAKLEGNYRPTEDADPAATKSSTVKVEGERKEKGILLRMWDKISRDDDEEALNPGGDR
jgi:outer membrane protein assembly factor BamE